ncbi:hypothetical protein D3C75_985210 [compost metagenome]
MAALFNNFAVIHHEYLISHSCCGETVGNKNHTFTGSAKKQGLIQFVFADWVKCTGRFIHNQVMEWLEKTPGNRNFLCLAPGKIDSLLIEFTG